MRLSTSASSASRDTFVLTIIPRRDGVLSATTAALLSDVVKELPESRK